MMSSFGWVFAYFLICLAQMNELMLHHIFGTRSREKVPEYWLDKPSVTNSGRGFFYDVTIDGKLERFWMEAKNEILAPGFHSIVRDAENSSMSASPRSTHCLYQGHSLSHNGSTIALTGCGNDKHGMIISAWGEFYLIQPRLVPASDEEKRKEHVIHKRSSGYEDHGHTCLFDASSDPFPEDRYRRSSLLTHEPYERMAVMKNGFMTIELAVFADDALWRHFQEMHGRLADAELHKFILAAVNNIDILYTQRSIQPKIQIRVVRYEVMKTPPMTSLSSSSHSSGDVDRLLDAFCEYQHNINPQRDDDPKHWDHALLFSGYDLYRDNLHTVAGYAPVKGMCSGLRSCTINEGLDFGSVFVVTHEMGHSLGMYHDGDNTCDLGCCIMSPSVGSGKTSWSSCSVYEMTSFIGHLGTDFRSPNCLMDSPIEEQNMVFKDQDNPGQIFTLDEQCEIFHGECWKHELKDGQELKDVCSMVWCGNGEGVIRTAHPALEGSYCGWMQQCRAGVCVRSNRVPHPVNGDWSPWNDRPAPTCGGYCTSCEIQGQIRVRRSIRQCNRPSANNGGFACRGDEARGLRCSSEVCSGTSIEEYAREKCTKVRDDPSLPNPQLTGEGMQFEQAMCKVWCLQTLSSNIRTVSNFPDGTPCGSGKYCIKGECRPLLCSGSTISEHQSDCPAPVHSPTNHAASSTHWSRPKQQKPPKRPIYKENKKNTTSLFWKQWSGWSPWSHCISYTCDSRGVRVRARRCLAGNCEGVTRQREYCNNRCTSSQHTTARPPTTTTSQITVFRTAPRASPTTPKYQTTPRPKIDNSWSLWSSCSTSCGKGRRLRRRKNCTYGRCVEYSSCDRGACPSVSLRSPAPSSMTSSSPMTSPGWTDWSDWSECSQTCGIGTQMRRRNCTGGTCAGSGNQGRRCFKRRCEPGWSAWSSWSHCSVSCGNGSRYRRRKCSGKCTGHDMESVICVGAPCWRWRAPRDTDETQNQSITHSEPVGIHHSSGSTGKTMGMPYDYSRRQQV